MSRKVEMTQKFHWLMDDVAEDEVLDAFERFCNFMFVSTGIKPPIMCDALADFADDGYSKGFLPEIRNAFISEWERIVDVKLEDE